MAIELRQQDLSHQAKILLYDIETSPLITYAWQIYEADAIKVIKDSQMLCFAYKWLGDKSVKVVGQDDFADYVPGVNDDKNVVEALWSLFDQADVVIAHNGNQFDQKVSQARMMINGLPPPSPYKQLDTKLIAKRYARFPSNKLDDLGKGFNIGQKLDTGGFKIWEGCMAGDKKSWKIMKRYNKQDVALLEEVYLKLRPWISGHPSISLMEDRIEACPKCGKGPMRRRGFYYTTVSKVINYQCQNCLGYAKQRSTVKTATHFTN